MKLWPLFVGAISIVGFTSCRRPVTYADARAVVNRRCIECHSAKPTNRAFPVAPQGVMLDTPEQMKQYAVRIKASAAVERTMPLANLNGMTNDERSILSRWVEKGAKIP